MLGYAFRRLQNSPGFAAVAIATVALAVGANTAMFSVVKGILLSPLPYPEPDRIVRVLERSPNGGTTGSSTLNYLDWAAQSTVFEYLAAETSWRATLTGGTEPEVIRGARVSPPYFEVFGAKAVLGRTFVSGEDEAGHDRVVVLSHVLWERRFGADPSTIGHSIVLNGEPHTVIGVLPKGGPFDRASAQIWKPLAFPASSLTRDYRWLGVSAKLAPGVTLVQARAQMDVVAQRLAAAHPDSNASWGVAVDRLQDVLMGPDSKSAVSLLFDATLFVWLIGCANLANLALARGTSREGEMAVRAALGASRWRLVRQVLIENVAIACCGGVVGAGLGYGLLLWIQWLIPPYTLPPAVDISMNVPVLLFASVVAVATGVLFGLAPALHAANPALIGALKESGPRTTSGRGFRRVRAGLVIAEIALAFVLLVAAGLLMRSFFKLLEIDPGFEAANVLTAGLPIDETRHPEPVELNSYLASIRAAVEAAPGVRGAALTSVLPLEGWGFGVPYTIADRPRPDRADRRLAFFKIVSPSYFDVLRLRRRAGRLLSDQDTAGAPRVAVINDTLARRDFPNEDPIGRRLVVPEIAAGRTAFGEDMVWEIVGVVAGEKSNGLGDETSAGLYVSNMQSPTYGLALLVRGDIAPQSLQSGIRQALDRVNRDQALSDVRTLDEIVNRSTLANRVVSLLFALFASLALLLAAVGIYGVISYTAAQRTHEMGVRAALGASASSLRALVFRGGMGLASIGLAAGLGGTFAAARVMSSMVYGVGATDPLTIGVVAGVLGAVAAVACFMPARRIAKINPIDVLRQA